MTYIPYDLILRKVGNKMQRHRKLHSSEVGSEMPARNAYLVYKELSYLLRKIIIFIGGDILYVVRSLNSIKYHSLILYPFYR